MTTSFAPFTGFPPQSIDFLVNLAANNDRAWFESHKEEYQQVLLEPAQAFVRDLGEQLQTISDAIRTDDRTNGSGVLMRIHRHTRFSTEKAAYYLAHPQERAKIAAQGPRRAAAHHTFPQRAATILSICGLKP